MVRVPGGVSLRPHRLGLPAYESVHAGGGWLAGSIVGLIEIISHGLGFAAYESVYVVGGGLSGYCRLPAPAITSNFSRCIISHRYSLTASAAWAGVCSL